MLINKIVVGNLEFDIIAANRDRLLIQKDLYGWTIQTTTGGGMSSPKYWAWNRDRRWTEEPAGSLKSICFSDDEIDSAVIAASESKFPET